MSFDVKGKVALITGGCSGIGLNCTKELLKDGIKGIILADINENIGEKVVQELKKEFGSNKIIYVKTDVADKKQLENAFTKSIDAFKNLDIVVNSAGICCDATWEKELQINLCGTISGTILALDLLPKYRSSSEGVVVNIASIAGLLNFGAAPIYTASKWGVLGASRSFGGHEHYPRTGVKVIAICPGFTDTPLLKKLDEVPLAEKHLWVECEQMMMKIMKEYPMQGPETVGKAVVDVIKKGDSGSVWVAENGEWYEIEFPLYTELRKK